MCALCFGVGIANCAAWLAPTSTWSFTARLKLMIAEKLHVEPQHSEPELFDGDLYPIQWSPVPAGEHPDISNLPSLDHALYLFNTVKFHLGHNFRIIHEEEFLRNVDKFYYGDAVQQASQCRIWFVQFLLVLAFGNAFLMRSRNSAEPPGCKFFLRAMSLMPDHTALSRGGFVAIEVLALTGLYLYSIDHRSSAHVYVRLPPFIPYSLLIYGLDRTRNPHRPDGWDAYPATGRRTRF